MQELILETIKGLLFYNFPKNTSGQPVAYGSVVTNFVVGKRTITGIKPPSVVIYGNQIPSKIPTFGAREIEHSITIEYWAQNTTKFLSEVDAQEGARIIYEILLPHRRMWVVSKCPICLTHTLSPEHYLDVHSNIIDSYVTTFTTDYAAWWNSWNASTITPTDVVNMLPASRLSAQAWEMFWNAVLASNSNTFSPLTTQAYNNILQSGKDLRRPIMELYDCNVSQAIGSDGGDEQQFLYKSTITFTAKQLVEISTFGPDGPSVPTEAI